MGPNGTGKSMSLQNIEYECNKENIICKRYSNKHNDIVQNWRGISDLFSAFRSEGERIIDSVEKWASRELVKDLLTNEDDMYILFDELDSGLSLDRMYYFFSQLTYILVSEKTKHPKLFDADVKLLLIWMKLMEKFLPMNNPPNRMVYA